MASKPPPPPPKPKPSHLKQQQTAAPPPPTSNPTSTLSPTPQPPSKRGLAWPWDHPPTLLPLFTPSFPTPLSWVFNWELWRPASLPAHITWIPCLRTASQISDLEPFLTDINRTYPVTHLLGFNEPEIPDQANLAVDEAVKLWRESVLPVKKKLGLKLGSPGMSSDRGRALGWLDGFFEGCGGVEGSRVDFLVCHWYGRDVEEMKRWLAEVRDRYGGLNVWVNEWACSSMGQERVGEEEVHAFMKEGMRWMDECVWIERYAYFGMGQGRTVGGWVGEGSNLMEGKEGEEKLTVVGRSYCT